MFWKEWIPPCWSSCTKKYANLVQIPWRIFCKKGCDAEAETWEGCIGKCNDLCYKDPVFKDYQWSAYIDRSPGRDNHSLECFRACVSGCGFKFDIPTEKVEQVQPNRPPRPQTVSKPKPVVPPVEPTATADDLPSTSA